jgi:hypothetical protein
MLENCLRQKKKKDAKIFTEIVDKREKSSSKEEAERHASHDTAALE